MYKKKLRKIYEGLHTPIASWYAEMYELSKGFTAPVEEGPVRKFGIAKYDPPKRPKDPRKLATWKPFQHKLDFPKLKRVDEAHVVRRGVDYFFYIRKENILVAAFVYNEKEKHYTCYMAGDLTKRIGMQLPNKAYFLFYLVRRALIDVITKHTSQTLGLTYKKEKNDETNVEVTYGKLNVVYGFIAPVIDKKNPGLWWKKLRLATITFLTGGNECSERTKLRAQAALEKLKNQFGL